MINNKLKFVSLVVQSTPIIRDDHWLDNHGKSNISFKITVKNWENELFIPLINHYVHFSVILN